MEHDLGTNASVDAKYGWNEAVTTASEKIENLIFDGTIGLKSS